ncbi:multicopper oxidase family protein [Aminobacter niigataensis]|uniref:multicopper oxidase family protein n=1 Tax=Aminobacter niigataensis TaxID=83265 RepID=UPI00298F1105|nr:multicopper oxidase domain-containing protein [Aminobacter niigataensis]
MLGGAAALAAAAAGTVAASRANAVDLTLRASMLRHSILPGTMTGGMMSFHADGPPPVLRLPQGKPFSIDVVNDLEEATIVHWHGLRIANAMDGVPYLTQAPITPGNSFRYTLASPDAGTYWYHPHCNTLEQIARGLTGVLVVEDEEDPGFDQDLPLNIRDFRLGGDGQFIELFKPRNAARGGTLGTVGTVNWEVAPTYDLAAGSRDRYHPRRHI